MTDVNAQSKSLLAKLLATENITIQRNPNAKTASFDVKNRVLELPVWAGISEDLNDMLLVHEVGHALDTPADEWLTAIENITEKFYNNKKHGASRQVQGFLNVVEDARIDKRQKRRYPGSRRNYLVGYKELIERDFFGTANREINSFSFIDRLNMYFKGGISQGIKFSAEENPFVRRCENTETFEDVVALTEELFAFCKDRGEENQQTQLDASASNGAEGEEGEEGEEFDLEDFEGNEDDEGSDNQFSMDGKSDEDGGNRNVNSNNKLSNKEEQDKNEDFVPESKTEKAWQDKQQNLVSNANIEYVYVKVPKPNMNNIISDFKSFLNENEFLLTGNFHRQYYNSDWLELSKAELNKFRSEDNATISYMVKEFEMKKSADIFSRISIAKTGVLDTNKLFSYKYNEDVFRRQAIVPNGKNHGFVMFLDWSGSMSNNIRETVKQLISLTSFCKRVQIPFEVYLFRTRNSVEDNLGTCFDYQKGDLEMGDFTLRNVLSSRMKLAELNKAFEILWIMPKLSQKNDPMASTPLNQAIIAAERIVKDFQSRTKVQIVNTVFLTDGGSDSVKGRIGDPAGRGFSIKKKQYILQDHVMKKDYYFDNQNGYDSIYSHSGGRAVTINLLKVLKDRTGCNLIGFFLYERSGYRSVLHEFFGYSVDAGFETEVKKQWNENKFIPVSSQGYDDYYVINTGSMKHTENKLDVDPSMTKAKIAKEFMKFSEKKTINRILLQRFIDKISSNSKKAA